MKRCFLQQGLAMSPKHSRSKSYDKQNHKKGSRRKLLWLWITLGILLFSGVGITLLNSKVVPSAEISPAQAYAKFQMGAFFLDVRSQEEWNQFHIAGSTLIPLDDLPNRLSELPKDRDIVVVCLSGYRSESGTVILQKAGFINVFCLSGGLNAWNAAGYALEGKTP
jgi:rhodanese-related sulfurtransferase